MTYPTRRRYRRRLKRQAALLHGMEAYARTLQDQASAALGEVIEEGSRRRDLERRVIDLELRLSEAQVLRALAVMETERARAELARIVQAGTDPQKLRN